MSTKIGQYFDNQYNALPAVDFHNWNKENIVAVGTIDCRWIRRAKIDFVAAGDNNSHANI